MVMYGTVLPGSVSRRNQPSSAYLCGSALWAALSGRVRLGLEEETEPPLALRVSTVHIGQVEGGCGKGPMSHRVHQLGARPVISQVRGGAVEGLR